MARTMITCTCLGTQKIDAAALSAATGLEVRAPCSALCTAELGVAADAIRDGEAVLCCTQEVRVFSELAADLDAAMPELLDLRDRAGWTDDTAAPTAKMAALIAAAAIPKDPERSIDVVSDGVCLILGPAEVALAAADRLSAFLGVTVLIDDAGAIPDTRAFDVVTGRLRRATGALGQFSVTIDALCQVEPGGRGPLTLSAPRDGGVSDCDVILDLRGGTPLFPAPEKREGYLRADPDHAAGVDAAILAASHLVGLFEKPLHVRLEPALCAHSRAGQIGCTRCLDLCPTGAIAPDGDHVTVDPMICAGCGACSAACPSGAISFDAPPVDLTMRRVQTLAKTYLDAGGAAPRLLVHDAHGREMIALAARHGRGLPADVIPLDLSAVGAFGHAEALAALAAGFTHVTILPGPGADRVALAAQTALAEAIAGSGHVAVLDTPDPDAVSDALYGAATPDPVASPVRPIGTRRQIARQSARALHPDAAQIPLPQGAPYGAVLVDDAACTLCLACVSLCPSGALGDNPDRPQLRFQEDACLQCGLCATICPEDAITLEPRLDLTDAALHQRVAKEEEPFDCVECGTPFGTRATIERITAKLADHPMFGGDRIRMIQMCDDCRVRSQAHAENSPFKLGQRPVTQTSEDYMNRRRDH